MPLCRKRMRLGWAGRHRFVAECAPLWPLAAGLQGLVSASLSLWHFMGEGLFNACGTALGGLVQAESPNEAA